MPKADNAANRILAGSMVRSSLKSFAAEYQPICSFDEQISGVKGDVKYLKRETNAKIKMGHYHVRDPKKVKSTKVKMGLKGLQSKKEVKQNGMMACYNSHTDLKLGITKAAIRWISCACEECF
jgi:hypothetical protein